MTGLGMVCSCGDLASAAQSLVDEVTRRLKTDPAHYLTKVAWSLRSKHHVHIWSVLAGQRFAVQAKTYAGDSVVLQADELERGLAALWLSCADGRTPGLDDEPHAQTPTDD